MFYDYGTKCSYLFYYTVCLGHPLSQVHWLMGQTVMGVALNLFAFFLIWHWRNHVVRRFSSSLHKAEYRIDHKSSIHTFAIILPQRNHFTCIVRTIRFVSSRAAIAVEVPKEAVPRWKPRTILPSLRYCSMGSQTRSLKPWTVAATEENTA